MRRECSFYLCGRARGRVDCRSRNWYIIHVRIDFIVFYEKNNFRAVRVCATRKIDATHIDDRETDSDARVKFEISRNRPQVSLDSHTHITLTRTFLKPNCVALTIEKDTDEEPKPKGKKREK